MNVDDVRAERRYTFLRRIDGTFGNAEVTLVDVGEHGMRFGLPTFVVWSRFVSPGEERPYRSGICERDDVLAVWEYLERSVELAIISRVLDER